MAVDTRALLRGLGALGATIAAVATFIPWYVYEVVIPAGAITHVFAVGITLWGLTTLAPILIVVGATAALICFAIVEPRWAGAVEALVGLGITAYALVRCFDIPNLGVNASGRGPRAATVLEGGPFLALSGSLMLLAGSLADLLPARGDAAVSDAPAPKRSGRFERGQQPRTRA
jgi:hypothetical protein